MKTQGFRIHVEPSVPAGLEHVTGIIKRVLMERSGVETRLCPPREAQLILSLRQGPGREGYSIEDSPGGAARVAASDPLGLLYGVGRFLHTCRFREGEFEPGRWRGAGAPETAVRAVYFPCRGNWYGSASLEEFRRYVEDLALWGLNTIAYYLPEHPDPDAPEARATRARNRELLVAAKRLGLRVALLKEPNMGLSDAPAELIGPAFPDADPPRRGVCGQRVCPSKPEGLAYLRRRLQAYLEGYEDIGVDYIVAFPYDSGGCGCPECWPWGARGYVRICKELARLARGVYPDCRIVIGTWCFDVREETDGEFEGLDGELRRDRSWADYVMADAHEDFPRWPLEHGAPGGLPMLNFPEISMWGRFPWGGFGANPLPARLQRLWNQARRLCDGGFPYSEGIFEDINKVIVSQFYWQKSRLAADAVREYVGFEFSPAVEESVAEAIELLERNYPRAAWRRDEVERACALFQDADRALPGPARRSWRWRILLLRSVIDHELITHRGPHTDRCDAAFEELTSIYHAGNGWGPVSPRSRRCLARLAGTNAETHAGGCR